MPHATLNHSEHLFELFCSQKGILFTRIQETTERRTNYRKSLAFTDVIVEVKELEPTAEEKAVIEADPESVNPEKLYHWEIPGERVRKKISNAVWQLKALSRSVLPTLLVLHDPVGFWPELLDANAVKVAMYGVETILISPEPAPEGGATILPRWHGSRRRFTSEHNTSLSAIGILTFEGEQTSLEAYHNWYASILLLPSLLRPDGITHFRLSAPPTEEFGEWVAAS